MIRSWVDASPRAGRRFAVRNSARGRFSLLIESVFLGRGSFLEHSSVTAPALQLVDRSDLRRADGLVPRIVGTFDPPPEPRGPPRCYTVAVHHPRHARGPSSLIRRIAATAPNVLSFAPMATAAAATMSAAEAPAALSARLRVYARVRPPLPREVSAGHGGKVFTRCLGVPQAATNRILCTTSDEPILLNADGGGATARVREL